MTVEDDWKERLGRRFARLAATAVVARPGLWRVFRGPLRAQFDRLARVWEGRRGPEALLPLEVALERVPAAARALDLGTGTGKGARVVARRYSEASVVGVDLSLRMVEEARRLLPPELSERVRFEVADASRLSFPDDSFDLVVLLNMIPFFPELARLTAAGGTVVFAFSSGAQTPIYVPSERLRERLAPLGFGAFEDVAAGTGTAFIARKG
jgi:SAM-dependent methyltransferase